MRLEETDFALRDTVGNALKVLAVKAHEKGIELVADIAHDVPDSLSGDPLRLQQILINLLGNAVRFTERGEVVLRIAADLDAEERHPARLGLRHGHRHPEGPPDEGLRSLRPGRQLAHAQVRRHGPRPEHRVAAREAHGRAHLARERGGRRQHVPLHGAVSARDAAHVAAARGRRQGAGPEDPHRRRPPHQPPHPRRRAHLLGDGAPPGLQRPRRHRRDAPGRRRREPLPPRPPRRDDARDGRLRRRRGDRPQPRPGGHQGDHALVDGREPRGRAPHERGRRGLPREARRARRPARRDRDPPRRGGRRRPRARITARPAHCARPAARAAGRRQRDQPPRGPGAPGGARPPRGGGARTARAPSQTLAGSPSTWC